MENDIKIKELGKKNENMREIIIETNGTDIHLKKAEVNGQIELIAILQAIIGYLKNNHDNKNKSRENK